MNTTQKTQVNISRKVSDAEIKITADLRESVIAYNEAVLNQKGNLAELDEKSRDLAKKANAEIAKSFNEALAEQEDPMMAAIVVLQHEGFRIKDTKDNDTGIVTREVADTEFYINLKSLHKLVDGGIGANRNWQSYTEQLNKLFTMRAAQELGMNPKEVDDSYAMSKLTEKIDLGIKPTSNTKLLEGLNLVVQAMIGEEFKGLTHDVNYARMGHIRKGRRALQMRAANTSNFQRLLMDICHRIVLEKRYDLDYRKIS